VRAVVLSLVCFATAFAKDSTLELPWGPVTRLASPDGAFILYERTDGSGPQLWIEDTRKHRLTKLFDISGTLSAAWSPDGSAFYVNNDWASDRESAFIYETGTLQRIDIASSIQAADPRTRQFASGHAYYEVDHWTRRRYVSARFFGHTDLPPVAMFEFSYAISRSGAVEKAGERIRR
jgi:dipeptidyl aminopeptidase/acylaminoacyl peptidase